MKSETSFKDDYRHQLVEIEKEIPEHEQLLAYIEPGYWVRVLTGSVFWMIEIVLYILIIALIVGAIKVDLNALITWSRELEPGTQLNIGLSIKEVDMVNTITKVIFLLAAIPTSLLAWLLRSARKNLFKLADVSEHLQQLIDARKKRREKVMEMVVLRTEIL